MSRVVWLTGPPASGKSTIARLVVDGLRRSSRAAAWLESDALRAVLDEADLAAMDGKFVGHLGLGGLLTDGR